MTIGSLPGNPVLSLGGQPAQFTVTLRNGTDNTYQSIAPLVYVEHCTCTSSPARPAPMGTLAELDPSTGNWRTVFYDREGTGMDYILGNFVQQPPLTLSPGAVDTFTFRLAFAPAAADGPLELATGQTGIAVAVVKVPSRTVVGNTPAASVPITVTKSAS